MGENKKEYFVQKNSMGHVVVRDSSEDILCIINPKDVGLCYWRDSNDNGSVPSRLIVWIGDHTTYHPMTEQAAQTVMATIASS